MNLLDDLYEVLKPLKEGGMGAIYKVRHRLLDEIRVVKVMRPQASTDPELQQRFLREAKMAIRVRHPNIGQLYDFLVDPAGTAHIVMEFIDGVTLQEVLLSGPPPSLPFALEVSVQVLQALDCLHFNGIVHRDVASDNVMITRSYDGRPLVKVIDLGIAKDPASEARATMTGAFVGKARYAAPEQFRGLAADQPTPATDLYSFGVLLYELLTGRLPIEGQSFATLAAGHLFMAPTPFDVTDPENRVPPGLRDILMLALEKDPARRIPSAQEFAEKLRPFAAPESLDPDEIQRLLARVRSAVTVASTRTDPVAERGLSPAEIDAMVDAVMRPQADPRSLEILDALGSYDPGQESVPHSTVSVHELPLVALPEPARKVVRPKPRKEHPAQREHRRDTVEREEPEPRPRRILVAPMAIGLLLLGIAIVALWTMRADPLDGQIESILSLSEDSQAAVESKLQKVTGWRLLNEEHSSRPQLEAMEDRLKHLSALYLQLDRVKKQLARPHEAAGPSSLAWHALLTYRREYLAADPSAQRIVDRGRNLLLTAAKETGSDQFRKLADEE